MRDLRRMIRGKMSFCAVFLEDAWWTIAMRAVCRSFVSSLRGSIGTLKIVPVTPSQTLRFM